VPFTATDNATLEAPDASQITVVLGDDESATRVGVRRALEAGGLRIIAEADTAEDVFAATVKHRPTVCLLGVYLPGGGILVAERIKATLPETKVVMLSSSDRDEDLFAAVRAGADGYLLKTTSAERLAMAVAGAVSGEAAIPRRLVARLVQDYRGRGRGRVLHLAGSNRSIELTAREFDVVTRLIDGESTAEIARDLRISEVTTRRHISSVEHKLEAPDRRAALALIANAELEVPPAHS
jgi:DNA-binding NarL/FixJ family response regulator